MSRGTEISIGTLAARTGLAVSAIRYYEEMGLVHPERTAAGQRRFLKSDIRRLSFVMVAQKLGFGLGRIRELMDELPEGRTPTVADWEHISQEIHGELNARIAALEALRDNLDSCIGCGCLSLKSCRLLNQDDKAAELGPGPRYLMGDVAE